MVYTLCCNWFKFPALACTMTTNQKLEGYSFSLRFHGAFETAQSKFKFQVKWELVTATFTYTYSQFFLQLDVYSAILVKQAKYIYANR